MALDDYSRKRDFARTPEPPAGPELIGGKRFVVQRHNARRLHYDLRLEIGGTLKSWAVPKGPTLDPKEKRLAVHVEDHPIEYSSFEGTIPEGNYGAGTMTIWDSGTFEVLGEPNAEQQLARGDFKFQLHGSKLMGNYALFKIKSSKKNEWLLLKKPDFAAQPGWDAEDHLEPVSSRTSDLQLIPGAKSAKMPERVAQVFMLREIEDLSVEETARTLGLMPATVKTRHLRARRRLQEALAPELKAAITGAFPFLGADCQRMTERVMAALEAQGFGA